MTNITKEDIKTAISTDELRLNQRIKELEDSILEERWNLAQLEAAIEKRFSKIGESISFNKPFACGIYKLRSITIPKAFADSIPSENKIRQCEKFWKKHGYLDRQLVVNKNNALIDGYIGYLVLQANGIEKYPVIRMLEQNDAV